LVQGEIENLYFYMERVESRSKNILSEESERIHSLINENKIRL